MLCKSNMPCTEDSVYRSWFYILLLLHGYCNFSFLLHICMKTSPLPRTRKHAPSTHWKLILDKVNDSSPPENDDISQKNQQVQNLLGFGKNISTNETITHVSGMSKVNFEIVIWWSQDLQLGDHFALKCDILRFSQFPTEWENICLYDLHKISHICRLLKSTTKIKVLLTFEVLNSPPPK